MSKMHAVFAMSFLLVTLAGLTASPARGASFAPISEKEKNLTEVSGAPGAPAVFLDSAAEFWIRDFREQEANSTLRVTRRLKVLTRQGAETNGEIRVLHSRYMRLSNFEGRTVLPDGRELAVGKDAIFRRVSSRSEKRFVTAAAFPAVEPGAILDWTYDLSFESIFNLKPWYFQAEVPVLHSEITYHIPRNLSVGSWGASLPGKPFQQEGHPEPNGRRLRVWLDDLPAIPDEPHSFPPEDLRARFMLIPLRMGYVGDSIPLMDTWEGVCRLFDEAVYARMMRTPRQVKRKAREIEAGAVAAGPESDRRAVAEAIYRFVRDEVRTLPSYSVRPRVHTGLDDLLEDREGNNAEKALLLQALLEVVDLDADLVWVPDRWDGAVAIRVPNPGWFERAIVRVHLPVEGGDEIAFLDPSDRRLGFGHLDPSYEDVPALVYDPKKPETLVIPWSPADSSRRRAKLDLELTENGHLAGTGELELTGHHAWRRMSFGEDAEELAESWQEWLSERWDGYQIDGVEVEEDRPGQRIGVRWTLAQREEEVLGDEASVQLSRPLGPTSQIFQLDPERRKTPVLLFFPDVDQVDARVTWPDGWELEVVPEPLDVTNGAGVAAVSVTTDGEGRWLSYARNLTISHRQFNNSDEYGDLRTLYERMEKSDAQTLVLAAK